MTSTGWSRRVCSHPAPRDEVPLTIGERLRGEPVRPEWMRVKADLTAEGYRDLKRLMRDLDLNTVCEEAGCPNIYECWGQGTATLMLLGDKCTRACAFCDVQTGRPGEVDIDEPRRAAEAVEKMGLQHTVLTSVNRDDLADGGAGIFAETILESATDCPGVASKSSSPTSRAIAPPSVR